MTLVDTETQRRELLFVRAGFRVGFDGGLLLGVKHVGDEKEHQSFFKHGRDPFRGIEASVQN